MINRECSILYFVKRDIGISHPVIRMVAMNRNRLDVLFIISKVISIALEIGVITFMYWFMGLYYLYLNYIAIAIIGAAAYLLLKDVSTLKLYLEIAWK